MSIVEQIFLDPGARTSTQAAGLLAERLGFRATPLRNDGFALLGRADEADLPVDVRGTLEPNIYADPEATRPEDRSIFDDLPLVLELQTAKAEFEHQAEVARLLFERLADRLGWRSALTSEYADLVATFDSRQGLRWFDPGTLSDGTHEHLWRTPGQR